MPRQLLLRLNHLLLRHLLLLQKLHLLRLLLLQEVQLLRLVLHELLMLPMHARGDSAKGWWRDGCLARRYGRVVLVPGRGGVGGINFGDQLR